MAAKKKAKKKSTVKTREAKKKVLAISAPPYEPEPFEGFDEDFDDGGEA